MMNKDLRLSHRLSIFWFSLALIVIAITLILIQSFRSKFPVSLPTPSPTIISTVVVPHHNVVKDKRIELLTEVAQKRIAPRTIVLLSPDHFSFNQKQITYADKTWNLSNGSLLFDQRIGPALVSAFSRDNSKIEADHGIYHILPDLKKAFPDATIVPIMIGQQVPFAELEFLAEKLNSLCLPAECLLVGSVDFSHYLPFQIADIHDLTSLKALTSFKLSELRQIEVDSAQSIKVLLLHAQAVGDTSFRLFAHTNSAELAGTPDTESTSHILGWFEQSQALQPIVPAETFTYAVNLHEAKEKTGLGERFFYGVDVINADLKNEVQISSNILVQPNKEQTSSQLRMVDSQLVIHLAEDLVITGSKNDAGVRLVFSPIKTVGSQHVFLKGREKKQKLAELFAGLSVGNDIHIDQDQGAITIDFH